MAANKTATSAHHNDLSLVNLLIGTVVVLVAALLLGGWWMQKQRSSDAVLRQQADMYDHYLQQTRTPPKPAELPSEFVQAQETRKYLLGHPAVQPGAGFDKPGVQSTGKAIVDAIEQAKGL